MPDDRRTACGYPSRPHVGCHQAVHYLLCPPAGHEAGPCPPALGERDGRIPRCASRFDHCPQPISHRQGVARLVNFSDTIMRRAESLLAILERIEQAGVPSRARLQRDLETEPPIGGNGLAHCIRHGDCHRAVKVPVRIRGPKPLPWIRPFRGDLATAYGVARFHLEEMGKGIAA